MNLISAAILIAVFALCSFAQERSLQSQQAMNPCDRNIREALSETGATRATPRSGKAKVELFPVASRPVTSKCLSLTAPRVGVKPLNKKTSDPIQSSERFSFELRAAKSNAAVAARPDESIARAQGTKAPVPQDSDAEAHELAKKLNNPVASLISFPMQSNFDFGMGTGSGWRYTLNVQPVIPIALSPKWNLISRTIIPIIHQSNVAAPNTSQSGLGDTVQSLFFSPNKSEPFIWAVGPVILVPTATDARLGAQKWGLGPTALALKQKNGWTYGVLANHIWSVAGKSNRDEVNSTFVQPFLSYTTKQAWTYSLNTESTYDWNSHRWAVPIHPFISKLVRFGKQPISFGGGLRCWVTSPTGGRRVVACAL